VTADQAKRCFRRSQRDFDNARLSGMMSKQPKQHLLYPFVCGRQKLAKMLVWFRGISSRMKACDNRGQALTTYSIVGLCSGGSCISSFTHKLQEATGSLPRPIHRKSFAINRVILPPQVLHQPLRQLFRRKVGWIEHIDEAPLGE